MKASAMRSHRFSRGRGRAAAVVATAAVLGGLLAACGGGSDSGDTTAGCKPSGKKVTLTFTSWVPGMQKTVDLWNKQNPDIQVKYSEVPTGNSGTYQNYSNQIKAKDTGDLGMVEFDSLPSFRLQGGLTNIGSCPGVSTAMSKYVPWAADQVGFGEKGAVYGIPQDIGPLALYYRKDLFAQAGIPVPTTWDEYYQDAKLIKAMGASIANFPPDQPAFFAALAWQNGAHWFDDDGGTWKVDLADDKTTQVADYWQKMIDEKLVDSLPEFDDSQWKSLDTGSQWTVVGAAWYAGLLASNAPTTDGKWAVAPMPQWQDGGSIASNWGGSTTVVFAGSKHPAEAAEFAAWAFGNVDALTLNNENGGQYPASVDGQQNVASLAKPDDFYGGQVIWDQFSQAAGQVDNTWQWGPTMTQTYADLSDGLGAAVNGQGTIGDALKTAQSNTLETMKSQAIEVAN